MVAHNRAVGGTGRYVDAASDIVLTEAGDGTGTVVFHFAPSRE